MAAIISRRRIGRYCAWRLGDDPGASSNGCRFYVYVGKACEAWLDYEDLDTAVIENPGEPVFDRATMEEIVMEDVARIREIRRGPTRVHEELQHHLLEMLRDLGVRDPLVLWHFVEALWRAETEQNAEADEASSSR